MNIFDRKKTYENKIKNLFRLNSITMQQNHVSVTFDVDNRNINFSDPQINIIYKNEIEKYHSIIKNWPIDKLYLHSVEHNVSFDRITSEIKYVADMPYRGLYS